MHHELVQALQNAAAEVEAGHGKRPRVQGMRADSESLNAQFERAFYNRRLPAWGLHNQTVIVLKTALARTPGPLTPGSGLSTDTSHRHKWLPDFLAILSSTTPGSAVPASPL